MLFSMMWASLGSFRMAWTLYCLRDANDPKLQNKPTYKHANRQTNEREEGTKASEARQE